MKDEGRGKFFSSLKFILHPSSFILLFLFLAACHRVSDKIEPKLQYAVQDHHLKSLPSPFSPLTHAEIREEWSREYLIGLGFAKELDLYQAITAFKRATFLQPPASRKLEVEYEILLCYYLGGKYDEATATFEKTGLHTIDQNFPAGRDLLIMIYDSYSQTKQEEKASQVLAILKQYYPETAEKLVLSTELKEGDIASLKQEPSMQEFVASYEKEKKSVGAAQGLNALVPGAGYLYLGQKQSALTAFFLNGLFIAASWYFFDHHNVAAGAIFASFEAGWYFGGIYGAGLEAKAYNERLYERKATPLMNEKDLFPVLMLNHAF